MSTTTADAAGGLPNAPSFRPASVGPLEQKHMRHANYRAVADEGRITRTHWHVATANGLGWGFDGMDGVIFALVSVSIAGGAQLATVTSGILVFGLYGLAFIGGWVEQVGTMTGNVAAQNVGTVASLIMPTEAIWQRAAYFMQPSVMRDLQLSPFSSGALPSTAMVWWAVLYAVLALLSGIQAFRRRAL